MFYQTYYKANAVFGKNFAGKYLVLHYQERNDFDHYGSRRHGVWYKRLWYIDGSIKTDRACQWYELFQIGPRGGIKRLGRRINENPGCIMLETGHPACLTAVRCQKVENQSGIVYTIDPAFAAAALDDVPETFEIIARQMAERREQEARQEAERKALREAERKEQEARLEAERKACEALWEAASKEQEIQWEAECKARKARREAELRAAAKARRQKAQEIRNAKKPLTQNLGSLLRQAGFM